MFTSTSVKLHIRKVSISHNMIILYILEHIISLTKSKEFYLYLREQVLSLTQSNALNTMQDLSVGVCKHNIQCLKICTRQLQPVGISQFINHQL